MPHITGLPLSKDSEMKERSREFKDGMAVLRMCGYVSRVIYLEAMAHLEDKYPDRGWIIQAE